eukprot:scaffold2838_cov376-Prasinococcus_capsulatus_cf.AAC.1
MGSAPPEVRQRGTSNLLRACGMSAWPRRRHKCVPPGLRTPRPTLRRRGGATTTVGRSPTHAEAVWITLGALGWAPGLTPYSPTPS